MSFDALMSSTRSSELSLFRSSPKRALIVFQVKASPMKPTSASELIKVIFRTVNFSQRLSSMMTALPMAKKTRAARERLDCTMIPVAT